MSLHIQITFCFAISQVVQVELAWRATAETQIRGFAQRALLEGLQGMNQAAVGSASQVPILYSAVFGCKKAHPWYFAGLFQPRQFRVNLDSMHNRGVAENADEMQQTLGYGYHRPRRRI